MKWVNLIRSFLDLEFMRFWVNAGIVEEWVVVFWLTSVQLLGHNSTFWKGVFAKSIALLIDTTDWSTHVAQLRDLFIEFSSTLELNVL